MCEKFRIELRCGSCNRVMVFDQNKKLYYDVEKGEFYFKCFAEYPECNEKIYVPKEEEEKIPEDRKELAVKIARGEAFDKIILTCPKCGREMTYNTEKRLVHYNSDTGEYYYNCYGKDCKEEIPIPEEELNKISNRKRINARNRAAGIVY